MMQAAMPHLIETQGNVVNIASTASLVGQAYTAPYAATKTAVLSITKSLAKEHNNWPVRINALAPGDMTTEMGHGIKFPANAAKSLILRSLGFRPPARPEAIGERSAF